MTSKYFNRELSWLEFNQRVLDEALDESIPLLERLKFLAITSSNLDEFFAVRVGGLQMLDERGVTKTDPAGMTPRQQLDAIRARNRRMTDERYACYLELEPALAEAGLRFRRPDDLSSRQTTTVEQLFEELYAVVTPRAVNATAEAPLLRDQTIIIAVRLEPGPEDDEPECYAFIPLSRSIARFATLPAEAGYECIRVEDVIGMYADRFFPGRRVLESVPFRICRNADLTLREDFAADLLEEMELILDLRQVSACVRLETSDAISEETLGFLKRVLDVDETQVERVPGPLDLAALMTLGGLPGFDELRYKPWEPQPSPAVDLTMSMFDVLARQDVVLYHPFNSFEPVLRLIDEAADDPDVLAIKQTLYRTSRESPIVAALRRAAEKGKYVTALVELRARFDEARNIEWARDLERAGVQVIYGLKGLKTHCKVLIIIRREPLGIRRYVHFGTGNYNESTAKLYTDVSFLTSDEDLGADATKFFNTINGYAQVQRLRKLAAAPITLREKLLSLIGAEKEHKRQGHKAHIMLKCNSLSDPKIIDALYKASKAGVKIEASVRGICCLRPGVPGLSENITVTSIIDRYLEHSRIFYFHHGGDDLVLISSADCMSRNLDKRVELLVPVETPACRDRLVEILHCCLNDPAKARRLDADGEYTRPEPTPGAVGSQEELYRRACENSRQADQAKRLVFEPYRAPGSGT
ncbi:MAG: polyphosphate kinase 1 [Planctomycetes bacterium]|nr:polyphosphate kinase 1 [Planctomycetota bacterium]